jgi:AraC-like DNA-binding protein
MKGLLLLVHPTETGIVLKKSPPSIHRYLPEWPESESQALDYSFGVIATNERIDSAGILHSLQISHLQRKTSFTVAVEQPGCYLHIRLKGKTETVPENTFTIIYVTKGSIISEWHSGLGGSLVINILPMLAQYQHNSVIRQLVDHTLAHPEAAYDMPVIPLNFWLAGAVNLLLNAGKNTRNMPDIHQLLHQLISMYLTEIATDLSPGHRTRMQLHTLTGIKVGKNTLEAGSDALEEYDNIIQYLLLHLRKNYDKKTIVAKSDLSEGQFTRLFKQGYGKPFKEGYTELRMIQALQWVVEDKKLSEIAEAIGYADLSAFSKAFKKFYGCPASLYHWPYYNNESYDD